MSEGFVKELRVDPRKIEKARAEFERWKSRKQGAQRSNPGKAAAQFDDILNACAQPCVSLTDLAITLGISRERMRQLYDRIFRPIFGATRTGRARQKSCTRIKVATRIAAAKPYDGSPADLVIKLAESHGLQSEAVVVVDRNTVTTRPRRVKINPDIPRESMGLKFGSGQRGPSPRVNWWDYFERWDLLGADVQTSTKV